MKKEPRIISIHYSDCYSDGPATIALLHQYLSQYNGSAILETISSLSFVRGCANFLTERTDPKGVWRELVRRCFSPGEIRKKIGDDAPLIFSRPHLLFVARESLTACIAEGSDPRDEPHWGEVGRMLLISSEILCPSVQEEGALFADAVARNMFIGTGIKNRVVRSTKMLDSLLLSYKETSPTSLDSFRAALGITIPEYRDICLTACLDCVVDSIGAGENMDVADKIIPASTYEISHSRLVSAGFPATQVDCFLRSVSSDVAAARSGAHATSNLYDFALFRDKPVVQTAPNRYVLIDSSFLMDKVDKGPFFALVALADKKNREAIFRLWGPAFEAFVNWLLKESIDARRDTLHASPRFEVNNENEEICDIAICSGNNAVLIECKGCYFKGDALDSADPKRLNEEIEKKLAGSLDVRQGATQLARSILRLYGCNSADNTKHNDLKNAKVIYPVLLVRDEIADTFLLNNNMEQIFRTAMGSSELTVEVKSLFCLSIGVLQGLSAFLKKKNLPELLNLRKEKDPDLKLPAGAVFSRLLPGYGTPSKAVTDAFDVISTPLLKRLDN